ncbi:Planctomycete cytochrome C [Gemmata obscuriglobus]|uniref:DUF1592 domain-containing protein n=1 Tax=Gemmata obscuriglobus TaxID=114 RepID=A0A2Z3HAY0_9BACT|nr:DUF1592 domain-containing protein [Gemmata obscuriglobus]AWM38774.1 DUF1592 domain-containing protein [Gemmata obscuriglobus]QEG28250.1 Planctomycete cytochrome C [Gemmata obscuriglobus]VTS06035.1 Uncharacterized protein OS=Blastopirellula marina DSM 3645 GN=DSM3645_26314 PE=4 SV=1: PSCyt1: PSD3: PSD5: PSD4: PSCyt3: PSD2 [Gemmata obscuriglobus UQM 2246]
MAARVFRTRLAGALGVALVAALVSAFARESQPAGTAGTPAEPKLADYAAVRPLLAKYCLNCHSAKDKKGSLDLERFASADDVRKDAKVWQGVIEQVEAGEMPPKEKPQPTNAEKKQLLGWVRGFLDAEAKARTGDPGYVPLRRLSNAEYNYTVRDLTGVDLRPAREFPADGAAGEGFTNAAEALTDVSPALLTKYLNASKEIAEHLVLLPDGFRFSPAKTRRDWTDEGTAELRKVYATLAPADGKLPVQPYLLATVRNRDALGAGKFEEVAAKEKLNAKYLRVLWSALTDKTSSQPLDTIRSQWRTATEADVPALTAQVAAWQSALWRTVKVGNYIQASWGAPDGSSYTESTTRQVPVDPPALATVPLRVAVKPAPGQSEVVLHLTSTEDGPGGPVAWSRPRFEAPGKQPLLLLDYAAFGAAFEIDYPSVFADSTKYLSAAAELARDTKVSPDDLAKREALDPAFLKQWVQVLQLPSPRTGEATRPAIALTPLDDKTGPTPERPAISGWKKKGTDLPIVIANSSDKSEQIPGRVSARTVAVHPTPQEFVAVAWNSPISGNVTIRARVAHAHPACGNGVSWWLDHNRGAGAARLGEGTVDLGQEAKPPAFSAKVERGDVVVLAVDPRNAEHTCDMTEVWLTITESEKPNRVWDLAADVAASVQAGNPHADKYGNSGTWNFARGPAKKAGAPAPTVPPDSVLGRWKATVTAPSRKTDAAALAQDVATLLSGPRPTDEKSPDRALYDRLVSPDGPLFAGVDVAKLTRPRLKGTVFGLPAARFTEDRIVAKANEAIEIRLPAALLVGREFVVDAKLETGAAERLVRVHAGTARPGPHARREGPLLGSPNGSAYKKLVDGHAAFRAVFPLYLCFPQVVPTDEVVTLKMFHREDEPLARLFLSDDQTRRLDRMWAAQRFVSRQPVAEHDYLPQFMGYTTQDTPKALQQFFIDRKPLFKRHADEFLAEEAAAAPKQLAALLEFAARAYRRPLEEKEKAELLALYETIRGKGAGHEEALRGVVSRVLVAPGFLFRIEQAPKGKEPAAVTDWELATRLSYFLWASQPDAELRRLAAQGRLRDPQVLAGQVRRMLEDARTRALAIEFGTQWLHVRGFDEHNEKNEKLFPTFTPELRAAMYEESILFFLDLFQNDRTVASVLDADHTYLNELLAKHYGVPGVTGPQWSKVDGVRKYGRGGVLGLASVQTRESGASRTSPVLRGNWVVEALLGEKLPRPPANVPQLPEVEGANKLSVRQLVEAHAKAPECAVCHVRIDPFGFAFEGYDPIGRLREKDLGGLPIDTRAKLKDGTEFEGINGLRSYLLANKKDVVVRLFCKRLLGYALGRSVTLSDTALIDEMVLALAKNDGRVTAAVQAIVRSPQFRTVRGSEFGE